MPNKALHIDRKGRTVIAVKSIFLMFSISVISPITNYLFRQVNLSFIKTTEQIDEFRNILTVKMGKPSN